MSGRRLTSLPGRAAGGLTERLVRRARGLADRARRPQTTVRWRLTLLYGALFLVSGAALLAITYTFVDHATISREPRFVQVSAGGPPAGLTIDRLRHGFGLQSAGASVGPLTIRGSGANLPVPTSLPARVKALLVSHDGRLVTHAVVAAQRVSDLHQLVVESAVALAIMALISGALGWMVAGRVLRPLRTITAAAREISEENLHRRLALAGPRDELRVLADTIDGLLERLEGAFDAQRRFVANASHELRTPLTAVRALLEMTLDDPHATIATFREAAVQALEESAHQERLIDALLALAQGQRGLGERRPVDLSEVVDEALRQREQEAAARGLTLRADLAPAMLAGDRPLLERLTCNLLDNALRHNLPGGTVGVTVGHTDGGAALVVTNTGPPVPADEVPRLLAPFQRLDRERVGRGDGLGLGLSIVTAIASAHGARLTVAPRAGGGLEVEVRFAARSAPAGDLALGAAAPAPGAAAV